MWIAISMPRVSLVGMLSRGDRQPTLSPKRFTNWSIEVLQNHTLRGAHDNENKPPGGAGRSAKGDTGTTGTAVGTWMGDGGRGGERLTGEGTDREEARGEKNVATRI